MQVCQQTGHTPLGASVHASPQDSEGSRVRVGEERGGAVAGGKLICQRETRKLEPQIAEGLHLELKVRFD